MVNKPAASPVKYVRRDHLVVVVFIVLFLVKMELIEAAFLRAIGKIVRGFKDGPASTCRRRRRRRRRRRIIRNIFSSSTARNCIPVRAVINYRVHAVD